MSNDRPNFLFVSLSGIGNFIMQSPAFSAVKEQHPKSHITVWVALRNTAPLAKANPHIDRVIKAPIKRSLLGHLSQIIKFRRSHFDVGVVLHPGQLWKSALYLQLAGIPQRIGLRYPHLGNPDSSLFLSETHSLNESLHDTSLNLSLLQTLNIKSHSSPPSYHLAIPKQHQNQAQKILYNLSLAPDKVLVGIHPGSASHFQWKRWPLANFTKTCQHLIKKHDAHLLIFGGPSELKPMKDLRNSIGKHHTSLISNKLLTSAALIGQCHFFLSNDSGLMHIAAALQVPTLGIFGPTSEKRTGPLGPHAHTIRATRSAPVYDVNNNSDFGTAPHPTLTELTPESVIAKLDQLLFVNH